jgi:hypothetical protein
MLSSYYLQQYIYIYQRREGELAKSIAPLLYACNYEY